MYKAVIIDDNKLIADTIATMPLWTEHQCEIVAVCYDSLSGRDAIRQHGPDIILTDIKMPGYDGLDVIDMLQEEISDAMVIFMSAYDNFTYAHRALRLGACDYLLKPFNREDLECTIGKAVETLRTRKKEEEQPVSETEKVQDAWIQPILDYITERLDQHITAEDTAKAFFMSTSRLDKLINQYSGGGFRELRISLRINKAKELLMDVRYSVEEVAMKVGYKNYASFYRAFTRECGIPPTEFRNPMVRKEFDQAEELSHEDS